MPFQAPRSDDVALDEDDAQEGGLFAEINITPLTDVILVLLIIFMVSSSAMVDAIREGKIDVTLPAAANAAREDIEANTLVVGITADGRIYLRGEAIDEDELLLQLNEAKKKNPATMVVVQADGTLQHRRVVGVIDLLRGAGFTNVGIAAEAQ